jgi:DNA-binding transcriptional MerR regulator/methylmalonyl-CoA mutase cobalamin-binding subunit
MYSIKAVSQATGLTVETLRAWERRFRVVVPQRDASGRRVYGPEDVLRLRRLGEATRRGHPISRLAQLDDDAIAALVTANPEQAPDTAHHEIVQRILDAAAHYRAADCEQTLTLACALLPPAALVADVLAPVLREVGERWHRGEFTIAQERLVSSGVRRYAGTVLDSLARLSSREPIVFATLPGERHELGLLLAAMLCANRGHRVHFLGPDLPAEEIARYSGQVDARIVALSLVSSEHLDDVPGHLQALARALGPVTAIWIGGAGAHKLRRDGLPAACVVIGDQQELLRRLDLLQAA